MNYAKTFFLTLIIYLGLNVIFALIIVYTNSTLALLPDAGLLIVAMMFGPIAVSPMFAWVSFPTGYPFNSGIVGMIETASLGGDYISVLIMFLYLVIPPLLAVIIGGVASDSTTIAFGSWFLTAIISMIAYELMIGFAGGTGSSIYTLFTQYLIWSYGPTDQYIAIILLGLINAFLYGCISFLVTRRKL